MGSDKRKHQNEENAVKNAHDNLKNSKSSRPDSAIYKVKRFKTDEHQGAGYKSEKYTCEIISSQNFAP